MINWENIYKHIADIRLFLNVQKIVTNQEEAQQKKGIKGGNRQFIEKDL